MNKTVLRKLVSASTRVPGIGLAGCALIAASPPSSMIEVAVEGVRSSEGVVRVEICPQAGFLGKCSYVGSAPAHAGTTLVTIRDIPPGAYAAQGFHDRNGNGVLDKGMFGIPQEGAGFSRITSRLWAEPRFAAAMFQHGSLDQRIGLRLHYYL